MVRNVGGKAKGEYAWSIKFDDVHIQLCNSQKSLFLKMYTGVLKPKQSLKPLKGFRSPTYFMWATIGFTEKLSVDCQHKGKTRLQQQFDGE